jgi:hypothetical protein
MRVPGTLGSGEHRTTARTAGGHPRDPRPPSETGGTPLRPAPVDVHALSVVSTDSRWSSNIEG